MWKITFILSCLICGNALAKLEAMWTGVTGVYITDGKTSLYFDPIFTRPTLWQIFFGFSFEYDDAAVIKELKKLKINKLDGIFISHTHFDHAIDMHVAQKHAGGKIFGTQTTSYVAQAHGIKKDNIQVVSDMATYQLGDFKVQSLKSEHGLIMGFYEFEGGELTEPLKETPQLSDYKMGGAYVYYISHPEGDILYHPASRYNDNLVKVIQGKNLKAVFQGISNRRSTQDLYDHILSQPAKIDMIIPLHHDNFLFTKKSPKDMDLLPGVKLQEFFDFCQKKNLPAYEPTYDIRFLL